MLMLTLMLIDVDVGVDLIDFDVDVDIEKLLALDEQVRQFTSEVDSVRQRRNDISNKMKGKIPPEDRHPLIVESKSLREEE